MATEIKPREARAEGPSRIDDPARTEAGAGARVNIPDAELARARGDREEVPAGTGAAEGESYTYVVVERAFKENLLLDPEKMGEDNPRRLFVSRHVYNSRALRPFDDVTKAAVDQLKAEHDQIRNREAPISRDESAELRQRVAELEASLKSTRTSTAAERKRADAEAERERIEREKAEADARGSKKS